MKVINVFLIILLVIQFSSHMTLSSQNLKTGEPKLRKGAACKNILIGSQCDSGLVCLAPFKAIATVCVNAVSKLGEYCVNRFIGNMCDKDLKCSQTNRNGPGYWECIRK
jgi:hypothetical protein